MKKLFLYAVFAIGCMSVFSSCKIGNTIGTELDGRMDVPIETKIEALDLIFYVEEETPPHGGARYQKVLEQNYYFVINRDQHFVESYLSYKGMGGRQASAYEADPRGPLIFMSDKFEYDLSEKDGKWIINIKITEHKKKSVFVLTINKDGSATLLATPLNKNSTRFNGYIK